LPKHNKHVETAFNHDPPTHKFLHNEYIMRTRLRHTDLSVRASDAAANKHDYL
jgi:hypothetical protein